MSVNYSDSIIKRYKLWIRLSYKDILIILPKYYIIKSHLSRPKHISSNVYSAFRH